MRRTQLVLGVLLLLQVVLILAARSPFSSGGRDDAARTLLPALGAVTVNHLQLASPSGTLDLVRDGESWTVEDLDGFPADADKIEQLVETLADLTARRPVVTSPRYHAAFGVAEDEFENRVRVWHGDGKEPTELFVGTSPNYRTIHVRTGEANEVYEVKGLASYDVHANAGSWIEKRLVRVPEDEVDRVVVENGIGRLELTRADGTWRAVAPATPEGKEIDPEAVDALIRAATAVRLQDAAVGDDASRGLEDPVARLLLGWGDGEAEILVGVTVPEQESQRFVTRKGFGFAGVVWDSALGKILEGGIDDYLREPEQTMETSSDADAS